MKLPKILFFIAGMVPTTAEREASLALGNVAMRNRSQVSKTDRPEPCDGVAGEVIPEIYADRPVIETLEQAISFMREKEAAATAIFSESETVEKPVETGTVQTEAGKETMAEKPAKPAKAVAWNKNA